MTAAEVLYFVVFLGRQTRRAETMASLTTASWTFGGLLIGVVIVVGALSFFAALALGPIAEQIAGSP